MNDGQHGLRHGTRTTILSLAAMVIGLLIAVPAAAQTLVNGNFEGVPQSNPYTTVNAPSYIDAAHSWKVTAGSVDVGTGPAGTVCANAGGHCVDLNGDSRGRIEQVIAIAAGSTCGVTFAMSRHKNLANGSASLNVFINNASTPAAAFVHNVAGVTSTNGQWQPRGFSFTAVGASTTIAFESEVSGNAGPQIDNVVLSCKAPPPPGWLTVKKVVVNPLNIGIGTPFNIVAHCTLAGAPPVNTALSVPAGQGVTLPAPSAVGSVCSATEAPLASVLNVKACKGANASWTAAYSAPVTIVAGTTAVFTVTNTLACDQLTGGHLTINKNVVNALGVPSPATFSMVTHCALGSGASVATPIVVPAGQSVSVAATIAGGTICSVTETLPPSVPNVKACDGRGASWVQSIPAPVTIVNGQSTVMIVTNTLTCDKPTGGTPCQKFTPSMTNCGLSLLMRRAKGPNTYTVTVAPASLTPSSNAAPSSAASCVNAGGTSVLQTNCAYYYAVNPTSVTLTATSSAGTLPAGFAWSGACTGSSQTCVVSVTQNPISVGATFP
jgi:hypothetical protein